jgi:4'-phosphopantetheinyl transferase EntD
MVERILPGGVAVAATRGEIEVELFPEEATALGQAVEKRRREFVTARACARRALADLGLSPQAIASGPRGEPLWPDGVVGSITHCAGYRGCAVAPSARLLSLGIDAEVDEPLPPGLLADVSLPDERRRLETLARERPGVSWDRLLFSIKESVYKAWYPLARCWLGFEDAGVEIDAADGSFVAHLLVAGPTVHGRPLDRFEGRWLAAEGLLLSAIALPPRYGVA